MSQVTDELKREQGAINEAIKKAKELGPNTKAGADMFMAVKEKLLGYLRKGDQRLYAPLRNAAKSNRDLQFVLELNAQSAELTTRSTEEFFAKYTSPKTDLEFIMDFGKVTALVAQRIRNEQNVLLNEFDKHKLT